jgi:hypothetical protein
MEPYRLLCVPSFSLKYRLILGSILISYYKMLPTAKCLPKHLCTFEHISSCTIALVSRYFLRRHTSFRLTADITEIRKISRNAWTWISNPLQVFVNLRWTLQSLFLPSPKWSLRSSQSSSEHSSGDQKDETLTIWPRNYFFNFSTPCI